MVLYILSLSPRLFTFLSFSGPKRNLLPFCFFLFIYKHTSHSYPYNCLLPAKHSRIFFLTLLISSPPLSLNTDFWRIFVLFRLFHMYLMRQKLGKNPLINAEVKIVNLLVCSGSFLWSLAPFGNYTWIIRAPCFK